MPGVKLRALRIAARALGLSARYDSDDDLYVYHHRYRFKTPAFRLQPRPRLVSVAASLIGVHTYLDEDGDLFVQQPNPPYAASSGA